MYKSKENFKNKLKVLGLDYSEASLITLFLVVIGTSIPKIRWIKIVVIKGLKSTWFKWMYGHSGNEYRVATFPKSYKANKEIIIQSLKSIGKSNLSK